MGGDEGVVSFAEASAKNDINVYDVFAYLVREGVIQRKNEKPKPNPDNGCKCILL